jgi:phage recombination protein Bet
MNAIATISNGITAYTGAQLSLMRRTVAADCNEMEFDLFMAVAQQKGLDPFTKQIHAVVYNKDKPDKRKMAIITAIDGFRVIAERTGVYRPDEDEPAFTYDPDIKGPLNPLGLVKAVVKVWKADKPATGVAYWEEFAPIKDEWSQNDAGKWKPTGAQTLDTGGNWGKMPRVMLSKCAEAQALRKAFPERLSGLYEGAEFDRVRANELAPSEIIGEFQTGERLLRIGASNGITFQLSATSPLEIIPLGQIADKIMAASAEFDLNQSRWFESANRHPLQEFWARSPSDALELKRALEKRRTKLESEAEQGTGGAKHPAGAA